MIILTVEIPIMGDVRDIQIDDDMKVASLIEELTEMICAKEQVEIVGDTSRLLLWDLAKGRLLRRELSARENGLKTGSRLLFA